MYGEGLHSDCYPRSLGFFNIFLIRATPASPTNTPARARARAHVSGPFVLQIVQYSSQLLIPDVR